MSPTDLPPTVRLWHAFVANPTPEGLRAQLAPDVVFHSPAVYSPQEGAEITYAYLWAAVRVLGPTLTYVHTWHDEESAVLRFTAAVEDKQVEGVDLLAWNADGLVTSFTVMARPFKGLQALMGAMAAQLSGDRS